MQICNLFFHNRYVDRYCNGFENGSHQSCDGRFCKLIICFFKNCSTYYQILHIFLQDNARDELVANVDAKFLQLSNYLGCKKFLMGNATTVADFALYDALKWHHALDGHLVDKYGNIVEYIGKQKSPKMT